LIVTGSNKLKVQIDVSKPIPYPPTPEVVEALRQRILEVCFYFHVWSYNPPGLSGVVIVFVFVARERAAGVEEAEAGGRVCADIARFFWVWARRGCVVVLVG
jgi:hypothetical protein